MVPAKIRSKLLAAAFAVCFPHFVYPVCCFAESGPVFGPITCQRGEGAPTVFNYTFAAAEPSRGFVVKVYNGGLEDTHYELVSSSIIALNGVDIVGPNSFNQGVNCLEVPVPLQAQNSLSVEVRGKPGGAMTLKLYPIVGIDVPKAREVFNAQPIPVSGHLNSLATSVAVNGVSATVSGASFSVSGVPLTEGNNSLTATAVAEGGLRGSDMLEVTLDSLPPVVAITYPPEGLVTSGDVDIQYAVSDGQDLNPTVVVAPLPPYTAEGSYQATVTATDWAGNQSRATRSFTIDRTAPAIVMLSPSDGVTVDTPAVDLVGTVDDSAAAVSVNGTAVPLSGETFSVSAFPLEPGANTILVVADDALGNRSTAEVHVYREIVQVPMTTLTAAPSRVALGQAATLFWDTNAATRVLIEPDIGDVPASGSITVSPTATTRYVLTAIADTGVTSVETTVTVLGMPAAQPEGSFGLNYADLVPPDATIAVYDPRRFAVVTGLVTDWAGQPLREVGVTVSGKPELGTTVTDQEGRYSVPVEGGGLLTLTFRKSGFLAAQRPVHIGWNAVAAAETVVMTAADPSATTIVPDGDPAHAFVHRASQVTTEFGTRAATVVVTGDTRAYAQTDAGEVEIPAFELRATEFTTPEAMPANLPPSSAFTYCVDISASGLENVRFSRPVTVYVDNFLGFDVGTAVPAGWYDYATSVWTPSPDGTVVRLLDGDGDGIVDGLDAGGDGLPDDLDGDGDFADEVIGLGDPVRYAAGSTFWRVSIAHLTPWDFNWSWSFSEADIPPNPAKEPHVLESPSCDLQVSTGSYAECQGGILHEDLPIPGTGLSLHYASSRTAGHQTVVVVPASGETVPTTLDHIVVQLKLAGRTMATSLSPKPRQITTFSWDGTDHLGRQLNGTVPAEVKIGFAYKPVYYATRVQFETSFARAGGSGQDVATAVQLQRLVYSWKTFELSVHRDSLPVSETGRGWALSSHHNLSLSDPTVVYKGDGSVLKQGTQLLSTVEGTYNGAPWGYGEYCVQSPDQTYCYPTGLASDAAGNLYVADSYRNCVRKVDSDGVVTTVAGRANSAGYSGDSFPATQAQLRRPFAVAADKAGNLYITDTDNYRVRKVDTKGVITTVVGNGSCWGAVEKVAANQAAFCPLVPGSSVAVDDSGNLYVADYGNAVVSRVRPDGIIENLLRYPVVEGPVGVAVDGEGNLYVADVKKHFVYKYSTTGKLTSFAGVQGNYGHTGDGGPAVSAHLDAPMYLFADKGGNVYIAGAFYVRKVTPDGVITTVTGVGTLFGGTGEGTPAVTASIAWPSGLTMTGDGTLYVASRYTNAIYKVALPGVSEADASTGDLLYADENGLGYIVTAGGRHKATVDLRTGVTLQNFAFGPGGVDAVSDRFGNTVRIERDGAGLPTAIVSPDGQTTELHVENNDLVRVTYPDGTGRTMAYNADGLLTDSWDPRGNHSQHAFDESGRLLETFDAERGQHLWTRQFDYTGKIFTTLQNPVGDVVSFGESKDSFEGYTSNRAYSDGSASTYFEASDNLYESVVPRWGGSLTYSYATDALTKERTLKESVLTTPGGLTLRRNFDRSYLDTDADGWRDAVADATTINGRQWRSLDAILRGTLTQTSPAGRVVTLGYQPETLLMDKVQVAGFLPAELAYDARGRLTGATVGNRTTTLAYDANGYPDFLIAPDGKTYDYTYDAMGRLLAESRPDGGTLEYRYDASGNLTVVTDPNLVSFGFAYTGNDQRMLMGHPLSGSYRYDYDGNRRLRAVTFPSGRAIVNTYAQSNLAATSYPEGTIVYTYIDGGRMASAANSGEGIALTYDGPLVTSDTRSGTVEQVITYTYTDELLPGSMTYAGATSNFAYDQDGLLTAAGVYTIARDVENGTALSVSGNRLTLERGYSGYAELDTQTSSIESGPVYAWAVSRDDAGRIVGRSEQLGGESVQWAYRYDAAGRLLEVDFNGVLVEQYAYDLNGNRRAEVNGLRGIIGREYTYSIEDHVLSAGTDGYVFDVDGFLQRWTTGAGTSSCEYSTLGELLRVDLADGTILTYENDPFGRRIAKQVNGVTVEKYLWANQTTLLAVYDGNDNLLQRYAYADARVPVSMTAGGATYFLLTDQVGTLRAVADTAGTIVKRVDYDSFGNIIADTNPAFAVPFGFAGGLLDRDTGLVRFGYRDYAPELGRFTAKDPIDFNGGDTNLYAYTMNDPVNFIDPSGLYGYGPHRYVPLQAGIEAGMAPEIARAVGLASESVDMTRDPMDYRNRVYHFSTTEQARARVKCARTISELGDAIHTLMDSFSHEGLSVYTSLQVHVWQSLLLDAWDPNSERDQLMYSSVRAAISSWMKDHPGYAR